MRPLASGATESGLVPSGSRNKVIVGDAARAAENVTSRIDTESRARASVTRIQAEPRFVWKATPDEHKLAFLRRWLVISTYLGCRGRFEVSLLVFYDTPRAIAGRRRPIRAGVVKWQTQRT